MSNTSLKFPGKTESTKIILRYLTHIAGAENRNAEVGIEEKIMRANLILESFGNSKTVQNNNSSRFGKFIKIQLNFQGKITGANVQSYLLEKSRIVSQAPTERNYHVFYQLCTGADYELRGKFKLGRPETFNYLSKGNCIRIEGRRFMLRSNLTNSSGVDDLSRFQELRQAISDLGISDSDSLRLFSVVSAILHLGNVTYLVKSDKAMIEDLEALKIGTQSST